MLRNKDTLRVSIITPSFNQGEYLEETIQSVLNQTYDNIEYLIIDGGSKDNSVEIIKKYEQQIAYWVSEPDSGQAEAINKGLKKATGDLLCWINSDDIFNSEDIAQRVEQFHAHPECDMIYGDIEQGTDLEHKQIRKGRQTDISKMLKRAECPIPQQSAMWHRRVVEKVGYLEEKWHVLLDREYFTRIAASCRIQYIPGAVGFFRFHKQSKSILEQIKWADELPIYYESIFDDNLYDLEPQYLSCRNDSLFEIYFKCATLYARFKKKTEARSYYSKARQASPLRYLFKCCTGKIR